MCEDGEVVVSGLWVTAEAIRWTCRTRVRVPESHPLQGVFFLPSQDSNADDAGHVAVVGYRSSYALVVPFTV